MRFNQRSSARHPQGGRLQIGIGGRLPSEQVAGFKSESAADFRSEWVADLRRNPHPAPFTGLVATGRVRSYEYKRTQTLASIVPAIAIRARGCRAEVMNRPGK